MRNPTYKHLEAKLRLGPFSVGQWVQVMTAGVIAAIFGAYLSPLPPSSTVFVSIVGAGMPVALSYGAMGLEFSVGRFVTATWRYWRDPRSFLPGPGESATGYVLLVAADERDARDDVRSPEGAPLWDC